MGNLSFNRLCSLSSSEQCQFVVGGTIMKDCLSISKQGVAANTLISVIRVTPPPGRVQLVYDGLSCGPSIRGSCGTFCLTNKTKIGVVMRIDPMLSSLWMSHTQAILRGSAGTS